MAKSNSEALAADLAAVCKDLATVGGGHALTETVGALAALVMGLEGHFHDGNSFLKMVILGVEKK